MRKKHHVTVTEKPVQQITERTHDEHEKVERLRAMSSISTSAIAQRDQYAKNYEEAVKRIRILETECRVLERERDAARAVAADLLAQLRQL